MRLYLYIHIFVCKSKLLNVQPKNSSNFLTNDHIAKIFDDFLSHEVLTASRKWKNPWLSFIMVSTNLSENGYFNNNKRIIYAMRITLFFF